jgi:hypothetical protein
MRKIYKDGRRIVKRFLWIPKTIYHETRWLEIAIIEQHIKYDVKGKCYWLDAEWINK